MRSTGTSSLRSSGANQGRVGGPWADTTLILIHHIGAKSGIERVLPLGCFSRGDGRFAIVASNGRSPARPAWYHNLKSNPRITKPGADRRPAPAEALDRLAETTRASGTDWALGIEARSRALLSMDQAAEDLYRAAPPQPHWPAH
jgi:deazaflavin-dependent oxidoreductase (nitroreductase family)